MDSHIIIYFIFFNACSELFPFSSLSFETSLHFNVLFDLLLDSFRIDLIVM